MSSRLRPCMLQHFQMTLTITYFYFLLMIICRKKLPDRFSHFEKGPRKKKGGGFQMTIRNGNMDTGKS